LGFKTHTIRIVSHPIFVVDAFTSRPFAGNPAAICPMPAPAQEDWMQSVAAEMKHAETAFIWPIDGGFQLRWFTPTVEVDLCGHATLAAAHALWSTSIFAVGESISFATRSGWLTASRSGGCIALDFPAEPAELSPLTDLCEEVLGGTPVWLGWNRLDWLAELRSENEVRAFVPNFEKIAAMGLRGLMITARSAGSDYDFVSRFFAPQAGVPEDSVTGSAHCCLGPYWACRLGRSELVGYQASQRGGTVGVRVKGDRVELIGQAVTVLEGSLTC
jgi:predicted PhzF superfamily epimerase YddE/YHI9